MKFRELESKPDFPKIEENVLEIWKAKDIFKKSLEQRKGNPEYSFYDGPPFATGLPHHGHLIQGTIKDIIPRYFTMKGYYVERRFGWDCHGLPVEYEVEKIKGIKNKKEIETLGIDIFNESCRAIVLKYAEEWKAITNRMGRWVDMENDYKTMDRDYMESIWFVFKSIYDKGLIYEGYKSIHICPRCATPLSNTEVQMGYKDLIDSSVIVKFKLEDENKYLLAWTTTPWTLPANTLLAINRDFKYVEVESNNEKYILAESRVEYVFEGMEYKILRNINAQDLIGKRYNPIFNVEKYDKIIKKDGWFIAEADFVTDNEGTGIVHIAPAFGEEDMLLGQKLKAPHINHVNIEGKFSEYPMMEWAGEEARDLNQRIIEFLSLNNYLLKTIEIEHSYPHCWRCDTPLLNYSMNSWFLNVQKIKDDSLKNNETINWNPKHIKHGRFQEGLKNAPDWCISRNRYWGTPLPVFKCDKCSNLIVLGSIKELEDLSNRTIPDIHRHFIDDIEFDCTECKTGKLKRIPEVLDCWFESGSMPYAQKHYPFENKDRFNKTFPADFIAEAIDQTRGWFYSLHTISTALMDSAAFKNVITTGLVQAGGGQKMSKSKKNYTDPMLLIDKFGAEALRLYLIKSPLVNGEDLNFKDQGVSDIIKDIFLTIYNSLKYFTIYANTFDFTPTKLINSNNVLDSWMISRVEMLKSDISGNIERYNLMDAALSIHPFIEDLSTWYIRRSRDRFVNGDKEALNILYYTLLQFSIITAPILPFLSEFIYQSLKGPLDSVHLENYPEINTKLINKELNLKMDLARNAISQLQSIRVENSIKLKQPINEAYIVYSGLENDKDSTNIKILELIKDEINTKNLLFKDMKNFKSKQNKFGSVGINTKLDKEIIKEGISKEIIREIQNLRSNMHLNMKDEINITIVSSDNDILEVLKKFKESIKKSIKSKKLTIDTKPKDTNQEGNFGTAIKIDSKILYVKIDV